jgi:hypothetical protein
MKRALTIVAAVAASACARTPPPHWAEGGGAIEFPIASWQRGDMVVSIEENGVVKVNGEPRFVLDGAGRVTRLRDGAPFAMLEKDGHVSEVDVADAGAVDAVSASTPEGRKWLERLPSGEIAERNVPPDPDWTLGTWTAGCARTANAGRACMLVTHLFVRHAERADFRAGLKASVGPFVVYSK